MKALPKIIGVVILSLAINSFAAPPSEKSIEKVLDLSKAGKLMDDVWDQMDGVMKASIQQAMKGKTVSDEEQAIMDKQMKKMVAVMKEELSWEKLKPSFVKIYRETFTQEEVDGLIAFYQSPAGKALIDKQPAVMKKTMGVMQERMGPLMQKIQQLTEETAKEVQQSKSSKTKK